ncbi:MAG TPA: septum formation initiator family protein [Dongiaceae bacterium]|jgi:cell division protein FtsB|nr:septum formation initiator family protein [Dongiaceae bacterium]
MAVPFLGACIAGYFLYHGINGERGFLAWIRLNRDITEAQQQLAKLNDTYSRLEHRAALLSPNTLDPDMLDEQARRMLGYANSNEIVILLNPENLSAARPLVTIKQ